MLWPARAFAKISLAALQTPLAVSAGWGILREDLRKRGLLPETTHYCTLTHRKKRKRIIRYTSIPRIK